MKENGRLSIKPTYDGPFVDVRLDVAFWPKLIYIFGALFSVALPYLLLAAYQGYALGAGIHLDTGCHGPELPFGMLSGILHLLVLRCLHQ